MIAIQKGTILYARDQGSIWQLFYDRDEDGIEVVHFDHRPFAQFYEGATGRSFYEDYKFGAGRDYVSKQLQGKRIRIAGEPFSETVSLDE